MLADDVEFQVQEQPPGHVELRETRGELALVWKWMALKRFAATAEAVAW